MCDATQEGFNDQLSILFGITSRRYGFRRL